MKRLVICCDGTWNTPDKSEQGVPCVTNVVKIADAVLPQAPDGARQLMYYGPGVGTSGAWWKRVLDGATGDGLTENLLEAYGYLIKQYDPGDELYFLGFSRGAFTVRSLAGMVRCCGILRRDAVGMLQRAYDLYRARTPASHPREKEATLFRRTYAVTEHTPIKLIGVWDTVGSLGNPLLLNKALPWVGGHQFHDTDLSTTVEHAYHAVAIDEKRRHFKPTLWHQQKHAGEQKLE